MENENLAYYDLIYMFILGSETFDQIMFKGGTKTKHVLADV